MKRALAFLAATAPIPWVLAAHGYTWFALFTFVPLLVVARLFAKNTRSLLVYGVATGVFVLLFGFFWMASWSLVSTFILATVMLAYFTLMLYTYGALTQRYAWGWIAWILLHAALVWFLSIVEFGWFVFSHAWVVAPLTSSNAWYGPVLAGSLLVAIQAAVVESIFDQRVAWVLVVLIALLVGPLAFDTSSDSIELVVAPIHTSYLGSWESRQEMAQSRIVDEMLASSALAVQQGAQLIVWPEYTVPVDILDYREDTRERIATFADENDVVLIVGTMDYLEASGSHEVVAVVFAANGSIDGVMSATTPRFFSEYAVPGDGPSVVRTMIDDREIVIGAIFCYEEFYPRAFDRAASLKPDVMLVLSDHSDVPRIGRSAEQIARINAMRYGIPIVRASNAGESHVILSDATVVASANEQGPIAALI